VTDPGLPQLGALIRRFRLLAGLSQEQLAERSGVSARAISDLERGLRKTPHPDTLRMLAEGLALGSVDRETLLQAARPDLRPAPQSALRSYGVDHALPVGGSPLIGREKELAHLVSRLRDHGGRLTTLTGSGGVGKTRLALEAARLAAPAFADGAVFVDLAPIADPRLVSSSIAQALGVQDSEARPLWETLGMAVRHRRLLLLLDNFEQVIDASPEVAALIASTSGLHILVTSREPLRVREEHAVIVPPLELPPDAETIDADRLRDNPAVALFIQAASAVDPEFELTARNATSVAEICQRLDGSPLAIELAASRVKYFPPALLLDHLDHRFALLTGGPRDVHARQQTLRDTIAWSYDLLSPGEQGLFRRLGAFPGGATIPAIEAVAFEPGDLEVDLLSGLASLVDKSLIRQTVNRDGQPRFSMLESLRAFALDQLEQAGEAERARQALAQWVIRFMTRKFGDGRDPPPFYFAKMSLSSTLSAIDDEFENIRQAFGDLVTRGDAESCVTLYNALFEYLYLRARFREALSLGRQALELAQQHPVPDHLRGVALGGVGVLETMTGRATDGEKLGREGLSLLRRSEEHRALLPEALLALVITLREQGRYAEALAYGEEARAIAESLGDLPLVSFVLYHVGRLAFLQGDLDRAEACLADSLELATVTHPMDTLWSSLMMLAAVYIRRGELRQAAASLRRADQVWQQIGGQVVGLFLNLYGAFVARVEPIDAARIYGAVATHAEVIGADVVDEPWIAEVKCDLRERLGDQAFDEAYQAGRHLSVDDAVHLMRAALDRIERTRRR
jgi:predicted ATPase/transcriptional regulator with XRE-family HTH domain